LAGFINQSKLKVLFICRGSTYDGIGHVTRSRAVARAMCKIASVKMLIIGDSFVEAFLADSGIEFIIVSLENEVKYRVQDIMPDIVIFDLTYFNEKDFEEIAQSRFTISLSPIFNCFGGIDLLFQRTTALNKSKPSIQINPLIKSGLKYAVIGENCRKIREKIYWKNIKNETLSIAISMGGTDAANKTLQIIKKIKEIPEKLLIWVMLGEGYGHSYQDLVDCIRGSKHEIILAKTNDSMWRILNTCSLVILAGGITTYEAVFSGLPSINTLETEKHYFLIKELVEKGVCLCAGQTFNRSLAKIPKMIKHLIVNRNELFTMHIKCKGLIDGLGVKRIVDEIEMYYWKSVIEPTMRENIKAYE
jgi:spore coat polysaccharide biosynthesis predicted glycosyltransferase SpsG